MKILIALVLALCCAGSAVLAESAAPIVTSLWYTHGGSYMPVSYNVFTLGNQVCLTIDRVPAKAVDPAVSDRLAEIARRWDLAAWDGFQESDPWVLDGSMFSFEMTFSDGSVISASGDNMFPPHYGDATREITALLTGLYDPAPADPAGTYRYEGEGFGGDFTLTLAGDGTFTYSEGPLSSYLGTGQWQADSHYLTLSEDGDAYRYLAFIPVDDTLYYREEESYPGFPSIAVPDGGKFVKIAEGSEETAMKLYIGETEVPVTWEDNASVDALRGLLPLTIRMSMYGGFEQVGPIGQELPREDRQTVTDAGDIVLYAGDQIVVFYGSNSWAYTRLGHVDLSREEMTALLGHGDVTLTLRAD